MAPPSPVEVSLTVGSVVFLVGGAIALYRSSVTRYHIPLVVLVLLTVTSGLTGVVGAFLTHWDAAKIDYSAGPTLQGCESEGDDTPVLEYSELSPEAQDVFHSTLQADGEYTTRTHPDEFRLEQDAGARNYIRYNSECYQLTADPRGNFSTGFLVAFYLGFGSLATFALFVASVASWSLASFKVPTAILAGLGSAAGLVVSGVTQFVQLAGAVVLTAVLTWVVLRVFERFSHESFRERTDS